MSAAEPRREAPPAGGLVQAVCSSDTHSMAKACRPEIRLLAGLGVEGDAHLGTTVQHRSRVRRDPTQPNLRQVHLISGELHDGLRAAGFEVAAGQMGENITTRQIDLLDLPAGALLHIGHQAVVEITGLRNPCGQLNGVQEGLMQAVLRRDEEDRLVRMAGVMGIVRVTGDIRPGDRIEVEHPPPPHVSLQPV